MASQRAKGRKGGNRRPRPTETNPAAERLARRVAWWRKRLHPRLPDIPIEDLDLILLSLLRPKSWPRRFFLREIRKGVYVP